uniref:NB-ARC domain-containing protein n=1 Tax=Ananas comosus var. bracteatus TaxID=296719 RepID=A0A6V7NX10_ANACO|nr:unnamed protein product [Ananas comosus var. bracteatus]
MNLISFTAPGFLAEAIGKAVVRKLLGTLSCSELSDPDFGAEHDMLIGRLADIYLAGKTAGLSDWALRYLHEEIQDEFFLSEYHFLSLVDEFQQRSRAATQGRLPFLGPATQGVLRNPATRHGLVLWLMKEIIGRKFADVLALIKLGYVDSYLETLNVNFAFLLAPPEVPHSYDTREHVLAFPPPSHVLRSQSSESEILGRDDDKEKIWQIISSSPSHGVLFVPISGMPGSGKTTLGQLVYSDLRVKDYFDCRIWVEIPRKFDIELIAMKIIKCVTRSANHLLDLESADELSDYLRRALSGRKFFLVLDDVWSRNKQEWELVKSLLSVGKRGSTVIVTTTQSYGGPMTLIKPAFPYMLKPLPEDICVQLLVKKVYGTNNDVDLTASSEIVKQIVRKCHGVPLAINMIGGMLRCQPENAHRLLQSLDSCTTGYLDLFTLIRFSYQTLPSHLQIENLEKVFDPEDAKRAQLNAKRNITSLALHWSWLNFYNDDNEASVRTAQQVLDALQPPSHLEKLDIFSYPGTEAPRWMTNGKPTLEYMVEIRLVNLKRLESLPPLGLFPCLKVIEIRGMNAVTCVDDAFSGDDGMFPKLEKLTLSQMPNLEKWVSKNNQNKFPHLRDLTVAQCPKLKVLHFSCSSLENLTLLFNNAMLYSTPGALKYFGRSLRKLTIGLCCELVATSTCEALHDLTALEELEISECDELISLPQGMRHLTSLRYLTITNCTNLETLPDWLTNSASKPEFSTSGCPKLRHQI